MKKLQLHNKLTRAQLSSNNRGRNSRASTRLRRSLPRIHLLLYYSFFFSFGLLAAGVLSFFHGVLLFVQLALQTLLLVLKVLSYVHTFQKNLRRFTHNTLRRLCLVAYRWQVPCFVRIPHRSCTSKLVKRLAFTAKLSVDLSSAIIIDTGCTQHMFRSRELFITYRNLRPDEKIIISGIGETCLHATGKGDVCLRLTVLGIERELTLTNVLYVPDLQANLVSGSQLIDNRVYLHLSDLGCDFLYNSELIAHAFRKSGLFFLHTWTDHQEGLTAFAIDYQTSHISYSSSRNPAERLWHERLGHISPQNLRKLQRMSKGIDLTHSPDLYDCTCEACLRGRMHDVSHRDSLVKHDTKPHEVIFSDIKGPMKVTGYDGSRYFVTFQDAVNKTSEVYLMKYKAEVPFYFRQYRAKVERRGGLILRLHSDGGGEYLGHAFQLELANEGVQFSYSTPESQQQNGASERLNRTLHDRAFTFMNNCSLPENFWPEAVKHANFIRNILPVESSKTQTPYEMEHGEAFDYSWIRTFGCDVWYRAGSQKKFGSYVDEKARPGNLVGFEGKHVIRVRDKETGRLVRASAVHFQETVSTVPGSNKRRIQERHVEYDSDTPDIDAWFEGEEAPPDRATQRKHHREEKQLLKRARNAKRLATDKTSTRKSKRLTATNGPQLPLRYRDSVDIREDWSDAAFSALAHFSTPSFKHLYAMLSRSPVAEPYEPRSWKQSTLNVDSDKWYSASKDEIGSLESNNTWTLVDRPPNRKILAARWVFKHKRNSRGKIIRYKARWVVKGYGQQAGVDFNETFASVVKPMSYKALFAIAAAQDLEIEQMDVKTAFLYGSVEEEIYVNQPEGFDDGTGRVCRLNKALYGLKQSPRVWYQTLSDFLKDAGFKPLNSDSSVFAKGSMYIAVYVDDLLIVGPDMIEIEMVKARLSERFSMTDLGPVAYYLGMKVTRDRQLRKLRLSQFSYLEEAIRDAGLWNCSPHLTPMGTSRLQPAAADYQADSAFTTRYQSLVGTLMYAMLGTRPDIAFAVSLVSRFASNPDKSHMQAVLRILSYLRGTLDLELVFQGEIQALRGFTDSSWADDLESRRSTSGFVFNIGSGAISWSSKRQPTVALSTCEAEYMAQTVAAKEAIWLRQLLQELPPTDESPYATIIYADNQGAIALARDPKFHARTKHIALRHHFIREKIADGDIELEYVQTSRQMADGFTKALPKDAFYAFRDALGLEKY
jgi:hypothetical protein